MEDGGVHNGWNVKGVITDGILKGGYHNGENMEGFITDVMLREI